MMPILAYVPFLTPLSMFHTWWYLLLLPLAFGVSIIYKALRLNDLSAFWREAAVMTVQIVLAMIGLAIALVILVQVVIPMLPAE